MRLLRLLSLFMLGLNLGAALGSIANGEVLWTAVHSSLAGAIFWQLRTYPFLKG